MSHSAYIADPDGYGIEVLYNLPEEVWGPDVDAALNYFETLDIDDLDDRTDYQRFGEDDTQPVAIEGRVSTRVAR
jgi:catechol 2,3-dioxygenase